ncbi:hypothetical protein DFH09DRAFT_1095588 [Mycena vulgaris]|nr:hypothetical protein DFH09DRAFT_1095588 [Mycena vulgaris]
MSARPFVLVARVGGPLLFPNGMGLCLIGTVRDAAKRLPGESHWCGRGVREVFRRVETSGKDGRVQTIRKENPFGGIQNVERSQVGGVKVHRNRIHPDQQWISEDNVTQGRRRSGPPRHAGSKGTYGNLSIQFRAGIMASRSSKHGANPRDAAGSEPQLLRKARIPLAHGGLCPEISTCRHPEIREKNHAWIAERRQTKKEYRWQWDPPSKKRKRIASECSPDNKIGGMELEHGDETAAQAALSALYRRTICADQGEALIVQPMPREPKGFAEIEAYKSSKDTRSNVTTDSCERY